MQDGTFPGRNAFQQRLIIRESGIPPSRAMQEKASKLTSFPKGPQESWSRSFQEAARSFHTRNLKEPGATCPLERHSRDPRYMDPVLTGSEEDLRTFGRAWRRSSSSLWIHSVWRTTSIEGWAMVRWPMLQSPRLNWADHHHLQCGSWRWPRKLRWKVFAPFRQLVELTRARGVKLYNLRKSMIQCRRILSS